ncbi:MAG: hypothetical protein UY35_C0019G0007 [Candidatus Saccharibacteria bacterium GW2011_GWC2_48_9]|nr:MAG: hypothetical protein UY35_C0019G0007 [Candidatus Saccharibacteria bacterium GW2011_GWC2_48_9]HCH33962.1 hypothetical protein [Candidatus Saccharibacteria bacterium]
MISFETAAEAQAFVRHKVDVPILERRESISEGLEFHAFTLELEGGQFTNVYDVSYRKGDLAPAIQVHDQLTSVYDYAQGHDNNVVTGGGFFFLSDHGSGLPRQLALNLAAVDGRVRNLPVMDREAVLSNGHNLSATHVQALGTMSIGGKELTWSGSLTSHATDAKVFANGNAVITHEHSEETGSTRVLDERSRFSPDMEDGEKIDVGFISRANGTFVPMERSKTGGVDIFAHDFVVRCHERYLAGTPEMQVHLVGGMAVDAMRGALSVGPMLSTGDFEAHPINKDASLGGKPPFLERPLARTTLYETEDGTVHVRLFDGRPGSEVCPGVTPSEVVKSVLGETAIAWGCFLDPGQTAKLCVRTGDEVESLGNRHYLKWATQSGEKYVWVPRVGRPTASVITLQ